MFAPRMTPQVREALTTARDMLKAIEAGKSYSFEDWDWRLAQIEAALKLP